MRFAGRVFKEGRFWAVEVPLLAVATQGKSLSDALEMIADAVEELVAAPDFKAHVFAVSEETFELGSNDDAALTALLLRRTRARSGMSLAQAAARLGEKSVNGYARYEQGKSVPGIKKLSRLFAAVSRTGDFVLDESRGGAGRDGFYRANRLK
jgi:predicted RNase H-like HicB family nuclease